MPARTSLVDLVVLPIVLVGAAVLWALHAQAWDLGGRSPILNYDTAQYALAARELAWHGKLGTPYALPLELVNHATPPWPLAVVQPGLVLVDAAIFRIVPARGITAGSDPRAWLTLVVPFCCFLMLAASLALAVRHLFARWWPTAPRRVRLGAALVLGMSFVLDPEAQHFAIGGFTELPFTLGLLFAYLGLALEAPVYVPFSFGIVLGLTGLFRANMLWLAPLFAIGGAACARPGRRGRTLLRILLGYALPLVPWWFYKWHTFGSPTWDLSRYVVWDHVGGRDWFSLYHAAALPELPRGAQAFGLIAGKMLRNLPGLVTQMLLGPRGLWLGGLVGWLVLAKPPRPLVVTALVAIGAALLGVLAAAASIPWLRFLFPTRVLLEPIGVLALGALLRRVPETTVSLRARTALLGAIAALAIGWGAWSTQQGLAEARATSLERGVPASTSLTAISALLNMDLAPGEPLMSNLGPSLAWQTNHPVVHLALSPEEVDACRRRLDFRHIVLVFREDARAWGRWAEVVEQEGYARTLPELNVTVERRLRTPDGFSVVWLTLGPLPPTMAANVGTR